MANLRKGDTVELIAGKDKGKRGDILSILENNKVLVSGINIAKKHVKPDPNRNVKGGIVDKEMPVHISNVAIFNNATGVKDKIARKVLENGKKIRVFKSDGQPIKAV